MSEAVTYLDASALVKLVVGEPESDALASWLGPAPRIVSSEIAIVEVTRAVALADSRPEIAERARRRLAEVALASVTRAVLERAATLTPRRLRSLDAIHVATALEVDPRELVAYDQRLLETASRAGLAVVSPGS